MSNLSNISNLSDMLNALSTRNHERNSTSFASIDTNNTIDTKDTNNTTNTTNTITTIKNEESKPHNYLNVSHQSKISTERTGIYNKKHIRTPNSSLQSINKNKNSNYNGSNISNISNETNKYEPEGEGNNQSEGQKKLEIKYEYDSDDDDDDVIDNNNNNNNNNSKPEMQNISTVKVVDIDDEKDDNEPGHYNKMGQIDEEKDKESDISSAEIICESDIDDINVVSKTPQMGHLDENNINNNNENNKNLQVPGEIMVGSNSCSQSQSRTHSQSHSRSRSQSSQSPSALDKLNNFIERETVNMEKEEKRKENDKNNKLSENRENRNMNNYIVTICVIIILISFFMVIYNILLKDIKYAISLVLWCVFVLLITFPLKIILYNLAVSIGSVDAVNYNSKYYSAIKPTDKCRQKVTIDHNNFGKLPHITIQIPVYTEDLIQVIVPTCMDVMKSMHYYREHGGTCNLFINDDGLLSGKLSEEEYNKRIEYYNLGNIGYIARPKNNRFGVFKKASNMNYCIDIALKIEKIMENRNQPIRRNTDHQRTRANLDIEKLRWKLTSLDLDEILQYGSLDYAINISIIKEMDDAIKTLKYQMNNKWIGDGDITIGDFILLLDADTRLGERVLYDTIGEFSDKNVGFTQHHTRAMRMDNNYWEDAIAAFTNNVYELGIAQSCAYGDVSPLVGHNVIIRKAALQSIAKLEPVDRNNNDNNNQDQNTKIIIRENDEDIKTEVVDSNGTKGDNETNGELKENMDNNNNNDLYDIKIEYKDEKKDIVLIEDDKTETMTTQKSPEPKENKDSGNINIEKHNFNNNNKIIDTTSRVVWWSESHVSEDFELVLRLMSNGYYGRYITYTTYKSDLNNNQSSEDINKKFLSVHSDFSDGIKSFMEGVSLTHFDEVIRLRKYGYGCCEIMFNKCNIWHKKGIISPLFLIFLNSNIPFSSKYSILAYMCTYFAIGIAIPFTIASTIIWHLYNARDYAETPFDIFIQVNLLFGVFVPLTGAFYFYRRDLENHSVCHFLWREFKYCFTMWFFWTSILYPVMTSILTYFLNKKIQWGATRKTIDKDNNSIVELKYVIKQNYKQYIFMILLFISLYTFHYMYNIPWSVHDIPLCAQILAHLVAPIALNPVITRMTY